MTTITDSERIQRAPTFTATDDAGARLAAAMGVAFVALSVASTFAAGAPPASDASAAKVAAFFHDHSGGIRAQLLLGALGLAALIWWFGALWRTLSRAEHERPRLAVVAAVGLAVGASLIVPSPATKNATAYNVAGLVAFFVWCVWIVAVSVTMWRSADARAAGALAGR